jgi:hypothetical protein
LTHDEKALVPAALENALSISHDDYLSKVVAYLFSGALRLIQFAPRHGSTG